MIRRGWVAVALATILWPLAGYAAADKGVEAGKEVLRRSLSSSAQAANAEAAQAEAEKKKLTDFQKKIAAIKQGEVSDEGETLSDFKTQAVSSGKKAAATKKSSAAKALKDERKEEEEVDPNAPKPVKRKTVGTVAGISRQGIAVEYSQDKKEGGREVWIPFSKKVKVPEDLRDLSGLGVGDKVEAVYDEYPDMTKQLTQITLLKKKPKESEEA